jgi:hypothetical protein
MIGVSRSCWGLAEQQAQKSKHKIFTFLQSQPCLLADLHPSQLHEALHPPDLWLAEVHFDLPRPPAPLLMLSSYARP